MTDQRPQAPWLEPHVEQDAIFVGSHSGFGENGFLTGSQPSHPDTAPL